jgi:hypothetical protein
MAWRWADDNVLHWGVEVAHETTIDHAELLSRVRAFEMVTVKHTYEGNASIETEEVLKAGPKQVTLPGFIAGKRMQAQANVVVAVGVDLDQLKASDMEIRQDGTQTRVIVHTPSPVILSTEIVPGTFDVSTDAGFVTSIRQAAGRDHDDLRDRAVDAVVSVAQETAIEQGILVESQRETERRLQSFLQSLPQVGDQSITYVVVTRDPVLQ